VTQDIRAWFENSPAIQAKPDEWPMIATRILAFVERCVVNPTELQSACDEFSSSPTARGFQSGLLSPILCALRPDKFVLINSKSRKVVNFFEETKLSHALVEYPSLNAAAFQLVGELTHLLSEKLPEIPPADAFDMFCHWFVAIKKHPLGDESYWKISPGEQAWNWEACREGGFIAIGWDELSDLSDLSRAEFDARRDALLRDHPDWTKRGLNQVWRFSRIKEGDYVIANKGTSEVLGIGTVAGPYHFVPNTRHGHRLPVEWTDGRRRRVDKPAWRRTLLRIDRPEFEEIVAAPLVSEPRPPTLPPPKASDLPRELKPDYPLEQLVADLHLDRPTVERWLRAIHRKKQVIMYGPPGTGKTYCAKHLARHLVAASDGEREIVQFHPSYGYEDFIQGIRPQSDGTGRLSYPTVPGRFLDFARCAAERKGNCVLIIDEINRANLSRVFGELMYLLEYRNEEVPLAAGEVLRIPPNVFIIGTMNTADRSIALIDHALRRRFAFLAVPPRYETLREYHERHDTGFEPDGLIRVLQRLNTEIGDVNYAVGVSFFMRPDLEDIGDIWQMEIEPYLEEYFFDQPAKLAGFRWAAVSDELRTAT